MKKHKLNFPNPDEGMERLSSASQAGCEKSAAKTRKNRETRGLEHLLLQREIQDLKAALDEHAIVAITDPMGTITYVNDKFCTISKYSRDELLGQDHRLINSGFHPKKFIRDLWATIGRGKVWKGEIKNRAKDGSFYWVDTTIVPFLDDKGKPRQYVAIRTDITILKAREREIARLSRLYDALSQVNQAIVWMPTRDELFKKICQVLIERGAFRLAWIGWHDPKTLRLEPVAEWGEGSGYSRKVRIYTDDRPEGLGPAGTAFRENRAQICNDTLNDPVMRPWHKEARRRSLLSCGAFPIRLAGNVCGILFVYAAERDFFQDKEVALLVEAAGDISFALDNFAREENRKKIEETLRLREQALEEVSQGVLISDEKRLVTYANASFTALTGFSRSEIVGRNCSILQGPGTNQEAVLKMRAALNAGEPFDGEILNYRKDGQPFWNELSIAPIHDKNGGPNRFIGIQHDVTERKHAEENRRLLIERLKLATEAAQMGVWESDFTSGKTEWDEQMHVLFGLPTKADCDRMKYALSIIHPDDRERVRRQFEARQSSGAGIFFDTGFRIIPKAGGPMRFIRAKARLIHNEAGEPQRMVGISWDVTEERLREQKLAMALIQEKELSEKARAGERSKNEFLAVMSHEIRTPLNGILGFSELLTQTPGLPAECLEYAKTITSSGEALLRILGDVLDFSRMEAGQLQIENSRFDLREILKDTHTLLVHQAEAKGLNLILSLAEDVPAYLQSDAGRLRQILLNLSGNAIKFTENGSVTLGFRKATSLESCEIFVRDTGPGISAEQIEMIFQPFTQADSSISRRHGGAGMGLTISRRFTELLGGTLTVHSQPGQGSEFVIILPIGITESESCAVPKSPALELDVGFARQHPLRILVVEDDKVNINLIVLLLQRLGYEPNTAKNGREAVDTYRRERPDFVLMDLQMPEMDGIEATQKIRALEKSHPNGKPAFISALTANIFQADRQRCFDAGMNTYLNKPLKPADLAAMLIAAHTTQTRQRGQWKNNTSLECRA